MCSLVVLTACETHRLTRRPEQADAALPWIWAAAVLVVLVPVVIAVVVSGRHTPKLRITAAVVWLGAAGAAAVGAALLFGMAARRIQLEARFGCREIPVEQRPRSFVNISCGDGQFDWGLGLALLVLGGLAAFIGSRALVGTPRTLWFPGLSALVIALAAAYGAGAAMVRGPIDGGVVFWAFVALVAAIPAACLLPEFIRAMREGRESG